MKRPPSDLLTLLRLLRLGLRHRLRFALWMALAFILAGLLAYLVVEFERFIQIIQQFGDSPDADDTASQRMFDMGLRFLILCPAVALIAYFSWYLGQWVAFRAVISLKNDFLAHLVDLDLGFHDRMARGDMLTRMTADMTSVQGLLGLVCGRLISRSLEAIGTIAVLFYIDWRISTVVFAALLPLGLVLSRVFRKVRKRSHTARVTLARSMVTFEQITSGIRVIKAMGSAEREQERYAGDNSQLFGDTMRVARSRGQSDAVSNGGIFFGCAVALLAGSYLFAWGWIEPAALAAFLGAILRLATLSKVLQRTWSDVQEHLPAADRVFAILDRPSIIQDRPDAQPMPELSDAIRCEGVAFRYNDEDGDVLLQLDLEIPKGRQIAIVGESGCGKSTLLDLIPRFYDVTEGRITWDGIDIRELDHHDLVRQFAIVQQDTFLFNDTVANNIRYGRPEASDEDIEQAARRANVHEAIIQLEGGMGYHTIVGDRGERLSGGQRQRIAIARALLRDAPVLLLDEPTSALDADSERRVQEALEELMKGRTSIIVAHRLSTVQYADRIVVLGKGASGIVESGSHSELIARDGAYARLVRLQRLQD